MSTEYPDFAHYDGGDDFFYRDGVPMCCVACGQDCHYESASHLCWTCWRDDPTYQWRKVRDFHLLRLQIISEIQKLID